MGLGKWWLKHGPGSTGAIAKSISKKYTILKLSNPNLLNTDILRLIFEERIINEVKIGLTPISFDEQKIVLSEIDNDIIRLIIYFVHRENPEADNAMNNFPDLYSEIIQVITEVVDKNIRKNTTEELRESLVTTKEYNKELKKRILIVDDNREWFDIIKGGLKLCIPETNIEFLTAIDGVRAIDLINKIHGDIDLIITNILMPKMDGFTMINKIAVQYPSIKIIIYSGISRNKVVDELLVKGIISDYLHKTCGMKELVASIKNNLQI